MKKLITAALLALAVAAGPAIAAKDGIKVGVLTCNIDGGVGLIIGSSKGVECTFQPAGGGATEVYEGKIGKLGLDIGITGKAVMGWAVFAPGKVKPGALSGRYSGASAEASLIAGLGANVLIGGSDKSINLQPISVQAQTGVNIAAGVASLKLKKVK